MNIAARMFLSIYIFVLTGCAGHYWVAQRSESLLAQKAESPQIIGFSPIIVMKGAGFSETAEENLEFAKQVERLLLKAAKANKVTFQIKDFESNRSPYYYDQLLYLKKSIYDANFENYASLYSNGNPQQNKLSKSVYLYPPRLPLEFTTISKTAGSKYFSSIRLTIFDESFTFQHVLVDTDLCETVFNEKKTINHKYNQDLLGQVVYDSFSLLKQELTQK